MSHLYRGSVKDILGPAHTAPNLMGGSGVTQSTEAVVFEYSDAFSVFDWGRMPDTLPRKGESLAILAADIFEKIEKPETWKEFSKSTEALALRKANRFGGVLNELGEVLQAEGMRTHYLGVLDEASVPVEGSHLEPLKTGQAKAPFRRMAVRRVSVVKPTIATILGRALPDYYPTRTSSFPRLIPLEVVFRFGCPEGSSLLERGERDPQYLASLGFPEVKLAPGVRWDFPVLEFFTKLESTDRPVSLSEGLAISGLNAGQIQEILLKTAWVSSLLRFWFAKLGVTLEDGKLEWGVSETGACFLVDAIGPDELRVLKNGMQLSKEFLRGFYRKTSWYEALVNAKAYAKSHGIADWKRMVSEGPPALSARYKTVASQLYLSLTNEMTGRKWFSDAWELEKVIEEMSLLSQVNQASQGSIVL